MVARDGTRAADEVLVGADSAFQPRRGGRDQHGRLRGFPDGFGRDSAVRAAIARIDEAAWVRIAYPWQILDRTPVS